MTTKVSCFYSDCGSLRHLALCSPLGYMTMAKECENDPCAYSVPCQFLA